MSSTATFVVVWLVCFAALMLLAVFVFVRTIRGMRGAGERRLRERYGAEPPRLVDAAANFYGLESKGMAQLRGSGVLALARHELWFSQYVTAVELAIPLEQIEAVSLASSHLGKSSALSPLLEVSFWADGSRDTAAWAVADPFAWQGQLEAARQEQRR